MNPPISQAPSPVILKSAIISYRIPAVVFLQTAHKSTRFKKKNSLPSIMGRRNKSAGVSAYGQVGSATSGQWAATSPSVIHLPSLGRLANKEIYGPILCYISLLTAGSIWPGNNLHVVSSVTSPLYSIVSSTLVITYCSLFSSILSIAGGTNTVYNSETKYSSVITFSS